jgi:hypothetical protein
VSNGNLSALGKKMASAGKGHVKNLMASETIEGYAVLMENVIKFPADVLSPLHAGDIPLALKQEWKWHLFEDVKHLHTNESLTGDKILQKLEEEWRSNQMGHPPVSTSKIDEAFSAIAWEEQRDDEILEMKRKMEEEEVRIIVHGSY